MQQGGGSVRTSVASTFIDHDINIAGSGTDVLSFLTSQRDVIRETVRQGLAAHRCGNYYYYYYLCHYCYFANKLCSISIYIVYYILI